GWLFKLFGDAVFPEHRTERRFYLFTCSIILLVLFLLVFNALIIALVVPGAEHNPPATSQTAIVQLLSNGANSLTLMAINGPRDGNCCDKLRFLMIPGIPFFLVMATLTIPGRLIRRLQKGSAVTPPLMGSEPEKWARPRLKLQRDPSPNGNRAVSKHP